MCEVLGMFRLYIERVVKNFVVDIFCLIYHELEEREAIFRGWVIWKKNFVRSLNGRELFEYSRE